MQSFRNGSNSYGYPIKLLNNHHPSSAIISPESEDGYAAFARAMGVDPSLNVSFPCDFYNVTVRVLCLFFVRNVG